MNYLLLRLFFNLLKSYYALKIGHWFGTWPFISHVLYCDKKLYIFKMTRRQNNL